MQEAQRSQKALGLMEAERTCEIVLVQHGETLYNAEERLQASVAAAGQGGELPSVRSQQARLYRSH